MPNQSEAHTELVRTALIALATNGYCAWKTSTGVWFTPEGVPVKYGKVGGADITGILPMMLEGKVRGIHFEAEAKTGSGKQSDKQKKHQLYVVERNGGIYILFYNISELIEALAKYPRASI